MTNKVTLNLLKTNEFRAKYVLLINCEKNSVPTVLKFKRSKFYE